MKTLTDEQAHVLVAFLESHDLHVTGAWPAIEESMRESFGIDDPEDALEDARGALMNG